MDKGQKGGQIEPGEVRRGEGGGGDGGCKVMGQRYL